MWSWEILLVGNVTLSTDAHSMLPGGGSYSKHRLQMLPGLWPMRLLEVP